jgi:hypothetical protein
MGVGLIRAVGFEMSRAREQAGTELLPEQVRW